LMMLVVLLVVAKVTFFYILNKHALHDDELQKLNYGYVYMPSPNPAPLTDGMQQRYCTVLCV